MKVKEVVKELLKQDQEADLFMEDAEESYYGNELAGYMGSSDVLVEGVRKTQEGVRLTKY